MQENKDPQSLYDLSKLYCDRGDYNLALPLLIDAKKLFLVEKNFDLYLKCTQTILRIYAEREEFDQLSALKENLHDTVIREGMQLTLKQFESVMEKFNIEAVGKPGDPFNPELHQAMSMQPHPDYDNNTLSMVLQKGYLLNGRVVRPAMVMVSKK